ncbi:hypothetical protein EDD86DRAFT_199533 [Gorgonomyces haynaldii]|nr:hypothetical protein EDD86DRAFT_199533 [Gorgonomyces haynaldii]
MRMTLKQALGLIKRQNSGTKIVDYPWLLSTQPQRTQNPSFWEVIKDKHLLQVGIKRAQTHLHYPAYGFPDQFLEDASKVTTEMFEQLSKNPEIDELQPLMVNQLAKLFAISTKELQQKGQQVSFKVHRTPRLRLHKIHLTYGPYPPPQDYVAQEWLGILTLLIPKSQQEFESHPQQKKLLKDASDQGVFLRVKTFVDLDVEFILSDAQSGIPLLKDRRSSMELDFLSPHFNPWDELYDLSADGSWQLKWQWRVSDIDGFFAHGWKNSLQ